MKNYFICILLSISIFLISCIPESNKEKQFQPISLNHSGISFNNQIRIDDSFNVLDFDYIYNGGGVAVGDFNNDGFPDIFFTGNMVSSKLYLNKGDLRFEDVTQRAGVSTSSWAEGVTLVDIDNNGFLDIYISVSNRDENNPDSNLLFVNQGLDKDGIPVFKEMASDFGIDDRGYNTQSVFFDYDGDGYLDLYVLSNALESFQRNTSRPREKTGRGKSNDKLYKNNGDGTFTNVTKEAGILIEGYGLGVAISDINKDGWPDIYVANDFITNDILYINNGDGTFTNRIEEMLSHQSFNAMGVDIADFNNDGLSDIVVLDMFPPDNLRQKTMFAPTENYDLYQANLERGYEPQYVRNTLQLNRGNGTFSEIGYMAGIFQTDWAWAPLFADFDNDGYRDLFVSNGYGKDVTDLDYINFTQNLGPFSSAKDRRELLLEGMAGLKEVTLPNYLFKNNGDLTFSDQSENWGIVHDAISNGAVYADFDNDGDLDILTNNLNKEAFLYQNTLREKSPDNTGYIKVSLQGSEKNTMGIGTVIQLWYKSSQDGGYLYYEHYPTKGYKSFVEPKAHFGLGSATVIDSLRVIWPDGKSQLMEKININQEINVSYSESKNWEKYEKMPDPKLFVEVTSELGIDFHHKHRTFKDFNRQRLLPHKHSENGPGIAVGDINGDGLDDFFVSGSSGYERGLFIQIKDGKFLQQPIFPGQESDDMGCLFLDVDNDGDLDLYIVSGGSRYPEGSDNYQDRLYANDGKGNFEQADSNLPDMKFSGSVVTGADYNADGYLDLFVGGRVRPGNYPLSPRSAILKNTGGSFSDVTAEVCPDCMELGMVTAAIWTDFDNDGLIDLVVVGEWMPVTFLKHTKTPSGGSVFENVTTSYGFENSQGWWNSILPVFGPKGNPSYLLGNFGKNIRWKASEESPVIMVAKDFDGNQSVDPVMFQYLGDGMYPVAGRDALVGQVPSWKNRFLKYAEFAQINKEAFFTKSELENSIELKAHNFSSSLLSKTENGFELKELPNETQISPVFGMVVSQDLQSQQILTVGNFYGNETITGRYDAGKGGVLTLNHNNSSIGTIQNSGFNVCGEGRALASLTFRDGSQVYIVSQHQGPVKVFKEKLSKEQVELLVLEKDEFKVEYYQEGNLIGEEEFPYGQGYLSQSSRKIPISKRIEKVVITDFAGNKRTVLFGKK